MRHSNQNGSILLAAIGLCSIIAITAGIVFTQSLKTLNFSKLPRIRANMVQAELQIKNLVLNPGSYTGCATPVAASCALKPGLFSPLEKDGIQIQLVYSNLRVTGEIRYAPTGNAVERGLSIQPRSIDVSIPAEILQTTLSFQCPDTDPVFSGFDASGVKVCRPVPNSPCGAGFVSSIDRETLLPSCTPIAGRLDCNINQMVGSINWSGGATFGGGCIDRLEPPIAPTATVN